MSNLHNGDHLESLFLAAQTYISLGYSLIPIYGDKYPEKAKVAAVNWKNYQYCRPSHADIAQWFQQDCHQGLAIVTGRISNLVVVDFDSAQIEHEFARRFPHLTQTRVIRSAGRGLSHYYYSITNHLTVKSRHIQGADLLSDGCYVIAPPTVIDDKSYDIERGGMPYALTQQDVNQLERFFQQYQTVKVQVDQEPVPLIAESASIAPRLSADNLIRLYQHHASIIGRNNALFKVACYARDLGWNQTETEYVLADVHVQQKSANQNDESAEARSAEAQNTLNSVFKRPARKLEQKTQALPTSVREALLKSNRACIARVLDGLFMQGIQAGALLSESEIKMHLDGLVGRHSILEALKAVFDDNTPIFAVFDPSPRTPSHTSVACKSSEDINKKCFLFSATESDKKRRGRPAKRYLVPDVNVLCAKLGVPFTRSDPIAQADIRKPKQYRQAVHRELIKRRPGLYSRGWLAARLGVSRRTCQRYDTQIKIQRRAMYIETRVTWENLHEILGDEGLDGTCLRDTSGKRYPAKREIAMSLLARGQWVIHLQQDRNYYWFGDNLPLVSVHYGIHPQQEKIDAQREQMNRYIRDYWETIFPQQSQKAQKAVFPYRIPHNPDQQENTQFTPFMREKTPKHSKRYYRQALLDGDAEVLAHRLYTIISQKANAEASRLSHANARRAVERYGLSKVTQVINVLQSRQNIQNPAGFAMMWLRSSA